MAKQPKKTNLFQKAAVVTTAAPVPKKSKKTEILIVGLKEYAELDAIIKFAGSLSSTVGSEIKSGPIMDQCVAALTEGILPESFRGIEDDASASCEIRKRSTNSPLNDAELAELAAAGFVVTEIDPDAKVVSQTKMFGINPKYENDMKLLEKVSTAIEKIVPEDFIVQTEEKSKVVVTEKVISTVVGSKKANRALAEMLFVPAIKAKLEATDMIKILDNLKARIQAVATAETAAAKAA